METPITQHNQENTIHRVFQIGIFLKGVNSILEIIGGFLLLFTGSITSLVSFMVRSELIEDPTDFLANHIQGIVPYFATHTQYYAAFYLFSHGIIKIFLVVSLLKNKLWAYPAAIVVLMLFVVYQVYKLATGFSIVMFLLTLFDLFLIILTWHEYKVVKTNLPR